MRPKARNWKRYAIQTSTGIIVAFVYALDSRLALAEYGDNQNPTLTPTEREAFVAQVVDTVKTYNYQPEDPQFTSPERKAELWDRYVEELLPANGYEDIEQLIVIADGARKIRDGLRDIDQQLTPEKNRRRR